MVGHVRPRGTPEPRRAPARCRDSSAARRPRVHTPVRRPRRRHRSTRPTLSERVLRLRGSSPTPHQRAMAAALDVPGGAIALRVGRRALAGLPASRLEPLHVLTDRRPHRGGRHLGIVHSTVRWSPDDVTSPPRDPGHDPAANALRPRSAGSTRTTSRRPATACSRSRLLRLDQLHALGAMPSRPAAGARRRRALRRLIELRPPGYRPAESNLERRFETILDEAGEAPLRATGRPRRRRRLDRSGRLRRPDEPDRRRDPERPLPLRSRRPGPRPGADRPTPTSGLDRDRDQRVRDLAPQGRTSWPRSARLALGLLAAWLTSSRAMSQGDPPWLTRQQELTSEPRRGGVGRGTIGPTRTDLTGR